MNEFKSRNNFEYGARTNSSLLRTGLTNQTPTMSISTANRQATSYAAVSRTGLLSEQQYPEVRTNPISSLSPTHSSFYDQFRKLPVTFHPFDQLPPPRKVTLTKKQGGGPIPKG